MKKTGASLNRGGSKQNYETPQKFMDAVHKKFGELHLDLAASAHNTKCRYYFDEECNSLEQEWPLDVPCWLNPPFRHIRPWSQKCHESGANILFLVPAAVGSNWFRNHAHDKAGRVHFVNGRVKFVGEEQGYPKDLVLIEYGRRQGKTIYEPWDWRNE